MVFRSSHCHANSIFAAVDLLLSRVGRLIDFLPSLPLILTLIVAFAVVHRPFSASFCAPLSESLHFKRLHLNDHAMQLFLAVTLFPDALSFSSTSTVFLSSIDSTSPVGMFARLIDGCGCVVVVVVVCCAGHPIPGNTAPVPARFRPTREKHSRTVMTRADEPDAEEVEANAGQDSTGGRLFSPSWHKRRVHKGGIKMALK